MEKEFIPYEQALALKELGFDEPCFVYVYLGDTGNNVNHTLEVLPSLVKNHNLDSLCISKPTFSQALRWFREKYKLYPEINLHDRENKETWRITITILGYYDLAYNQNIAKEPYHKTYEEAELECLNKLIEIAKEKQQ